MQNAKPIRNRNLFLTMFRHPKENAESLVYLAMSGVCMASVILLNFIR